MHVKVLTPASSANLGPGFDTLGLALKIYNELEIDTETRIPTIEIEGEGGAALPKGKQNLSYRAAAKVFEAVGEAVPPLYIRQLNRIPIASGLGSSAAAIVGGLMAANHLLGSPLAVDRLLGLAVEIEGHPDNVAPALLGGLVVSGTDSGKVTWYQIQTDKPPYVIVISPDFHLSTSRARQALPRRVLLADAVHNMSRTAFLLNCFSSGDYRYLRFAMEDKLHQPYRARLIPGLNAVIDACYEAGGIGAALSGAGPAVIGFVDRSSKEKAVETAAKMQHAFAVHGIKSRPILTEICTTGAVLAG